MREPGGKLVGIDTCLASEIGWLWHNGVRTIESCCGHNKNGGYIAVEFVSVGRMRELGYKNLTREQRKTGDNKNFFFPHFGPYAYDVSGLLRTAELSYQAGLSGQKPKRASKAKAPAAAKQKRPDTDPMDRKEFLEWCRKSPSKHIQIIAEWAEAEGPTYTTIGQWRAFIARNVRVAKRLIPFELAQIEAAYAKMAKDIKTPRNPKGFITKYSLETLEKYL